MPPTSTTMRAMVFEAPRVPLALRTLAVPRPAREEILVAVHTCGVCRTDLHLVDGDFPDVRGPRIPGHEIVGTVVERGAGVTRFAIGQRVGIPWLADTCGGCARCLEGHENLCADARFTGFSRDGGYADFVVADARFAFALPDRYDDLHAAPLLCAGLIGYRAYAMAAHAGVLGLYGFGAAAHILAQVALAQRRTVFAFTRAGDDRSQAFARALGVHWAGASHETPPLPLDAALLFAPAGALVPQALAATRPGGSVICAGIHMSDIPPLPYRLLWQERVLRSVAHLTRADGDAFFDLAARIPIAVQATAYPLEHANDALAALREGRIDGAAVLTSARH